MNFRPRTPEEMHASALARASSAFCTVEPHRAAARAAVSYQDAGTTCGQFHIPFLGTMHHVDWPKGTAQRAANRQEADIATRILLLHYLLAADGTPIAGRWIAFRNLPGGLGYDAAFQGRTSARLAHAFGETRPAFERAAQALGGERLSFGDSSFLFRALPRVWLAMVLHLADDEFPANVNVLFDAAASHYLPTEDLAILGGILAGRLIKAAHNP